MQRIREKYVKPVSLTWWSGMVPIAIGVFIATEPVHQLTDWVQAAKAATDNVSPAILINAGLAIIGLRGAQNA